MDARQHDGQAEHKAEDKDGGEHQAVRLDVGHVAQLAGFTHPQQHIEPIKNSWKHISPSMSVVSGVDFGLTGSASTAAPVCQAVSEGVSVCQANRSDL